MLEAMFDSASKLPPSLVAIGLLLLIWPFLHRTTESLVVQASASKVNPNDIPTALPDSESKYTDSRGQESIFFCHFGIAVFVCCLLGK